MHALNWAIDCIGMDSFIFYKKNFQGLEFIHISDFDIIKNDTIMIKRMG